MQQARPLVGETSQFEDIPVRLFLDSSTLQTLHTYGAYLYENEPLSNTDPIRRDPHGLAKLDALKAIMAVSERAPFQFALSENSFEEVDRKRDASYLQWAFDVLMHWLDCLEADGPPQGSAAALAAIDGPSFNYLGAGDRALLKDAIALDCDAFLTIENKLPRAAPHIARTLGIRVLTPLDMWTILAPWAALFR